MKPGLEGSDLEDIKTRHEAELLRFPNVVGVATGVRTTGGKTGEERCIVVFVTTKIPERELGEGDVLPRELEGVPVDVVEAGRIEPLPA